MSSGELICSHCETVVDTRGCSRCWWMTPLPKVIRRTSLTIHAGGGGYPEPPIIPVPPTITLINSVSFYDLSASTTNLTMPNVTLAPDSYLMVIQSFHNAQEGNDGTVEWDQPYSQAAGQLVEPYDQVRSQGGSIWVMGPFPGGGTHDAIVNYGGIGGQDGYPNSAVMFAYEIAGALSGGVATMVDSPYSGFPGSITHNTNSGDGTVASQTPTNPIRYLGDLGVVMVVTFGPSVDDPGAWPGNYTALDRVGTNGASTTDNTTLSTAKWYPQSLGGHSVSKSGFTSREWAIGHIYLRGI